MNDTAPLRRIWLCADDYGIAEGVNRAIRDLIGRGRLNATSVMVVGPSMTTCESRTQSSPRVTPSPMRQKGPIRTRSPIRASG